MPVKINFLWNLINPQYALSLGITLIICVALISYFLIRNRPKIKRWLTLLSEFLVSVGVIGLLTFAARALIDSEIRNDAKQLKEDQRLVNVASINIFQNHCLPGQSTVRPTPEMENIYVACDISIQFLDGTTDPMRYWLVRDRLKKLTTLANPSNEVAVRINALKDAVNNVIEADTVTDRNLHRKMLVESDVSWILILVCAGSAILGIGFKWARAVLEFRKRPGE
jgi:hypothetical protein